MKFLIVVITANDVKLNTTYYRTESRYTKNCIFRLQEEDKYIYEHYGSRMPAYIEIK